MSDALLPAPWLPAALAGVGLAAVLVGTLVFRLHAILSLTLAGLAVMWLTPRELVVRAEVEATAERFRVRGVGRSPQTALVYGTRGAYWTDDRRDDLRAFRPVPGGGLGAPAATLARLRADRQIAGRVIGGPDDGLPGFGFEMTGPFGRERTPTGQSAMIDGERLVRLDAGDYRVAPLFESLNPFAEPEPPLRPGDLLVSAGDLAAAGDAAARPAPARFAAAFGGTAGGIGLPIAFAAVLGACLAASGAAERLVRAALAVVGPRGRPAAFCAGGFALGVPVFFDAVFLLCAPLAKSAAAPGGDGKPGANYGLLLMAVACGGVMTHSLVPPTPGPLLVADELGVSLPALAAAGLFVSAVAAPLGLLAAWGLTRRTRIDPPADPAPRGETPPHELPALWASALPLAVPAFLIAQAAAWRFGPDRFPGKEPVGPVVAALGDPTVALLAGALAALGLLWRRSVPAERTEVVGEAVAEGGAVLLIAACGGAFGAALRQTGVGGLVAGLPVGGGFGLLVTAWAAAAAVRTAQGSATVAMVTAAGVVGGAVQAGPVAPVWVACAIGCGSKAVAWMNASGFWVVCKAGGLTERQALATFTPLTGVLSVAGLAATLLGARVWP